MGGPGYLKSMKITNTMKIRRAWDALFPNKIRSTTPDTITVMDSELAQLLVCAWGLLEEQRRISIWDIMMKQPLSPNAQSSQRKTISENSQIIGAMVIENVHNRDSAKELLDLQKIKTTITMRQRRPGVVRMISLIMITR